MRPGDGRQSPALREANGDLANCESMDPTPIRHGHSRLEPGFGAIPILMPAPAFPTLKGGEVTGKGHGMTTLVEVHFHGIEKSDAIEQRVRDKVAKLQSHFERMTSCRVGIEATQRNPQKPKVYQIKLEIAIPRRQPIVVTHERVGSHASEELCLSIRDAFEAALRKVDGTAARVTQRAKLERGRRRPRQVEEGAET
jgi:putative sigma-54 modulation protein